MKEIKKSSLQEPTSIKIGTKMHYHPNLHWKKLTMATIFVTYPTWDGMISLKSKPFLWFPHKKVMYFSCIKPTRNSNITISWQILPKLPTKNPWLSTNIQNFTKKQKAKKRDLNALVFYQFSWGKKLIAEKSFLFEMIQTAQWKQEPVTLKTKPPAGEVPLGYN